MAQTDVTLERRGRVGILTLNRPEKLNALTWEMLALIDEHLQTVRQDPAIRALVLTGAGRAFSAGTDLQELSARDPKDRGARERSEPLKEIAAPWTYTNVNVPTVAAINGAGVGLGAEMPLMCDLRIAGERARLGWVFPHRGLVPDAGAGTWLLPRVVGISRAAQILYSGAILDAPTMLGLGLVDEVVPQEQLLDRAVAVAESLSTGSPLAIGEIKRLLYRGLSRTAEEHLKDNVQTMARMFQSADHKEGVASFLEKRDPVWTGR